MSDPETAPPRDDAGAPDAGPGDDAAAGATTGATALGDDDATEEGSAGSGDDAAAGGTAAPAGA